MLVEFADDEDNVLAISARDVSSVYDNGSETTHIYMTGNQTPITVAGSFAEVVAKLNHAFENSQTLH